MMNENHISKEQFLFEFFGTIGGREFGNPKQWFVNDPTSIVEFIEYCKEKKIPAFMSVQPRRKHYDVLGFEKIFFDFDYADKTFIKKLDIQLLNEEIDRLIKNEQLGEESRQSYFDEKHPDKKTCILNDESLNIKKEILDERRNSLPDEVKKFVRNLISPNDPDILPVTPLIVKTNKGYHVYIYFDSVYEIDNDIEFWCEVYGTLYKSFYRNGDKFRFIDTSSETDIFRMSRIPLSTHEKSGLECIIVDENLKPTKIRGIGYYKLHGLRKNDLLKAMNITRDILLKEKLKEKLKHDFQPIENVKYIYSGKIRPCFLSALELREMPHKMRLAMLLEAWFMENKHSREELINIFRDLNDFNEKITTDQVDWFLENKIYETFKPYSCDTMIKENWCVQDKCYKYKYKK